MQDEDKLEMSKKSSATGVGLNLGVNICDPALPITLSLPLVTSESPSLSSSSSSSSASLSPYANLTAAGDAIVQGPDLSPPDSGRSSMGTESLVGNLTTLFSTALDLSPSASVWSEAGTGPADGSTFSSAPISPFSAANPTWSVSPRKTSPTFGPSLWNPAAPVLGAPPPLPPHQQQHPAWGSVGRFCRGTSFTGRTLSSVFGSLTGHVTLAPPALEVTNADEGSPYIYQDQYGMAANGLDSNLATLDGFFHDSMPQENDMFAGKTGYYGYGYSAADASYADQHPAHSSSVRQSNFGLDAIAGIAAHQDGTGMNYIHPLTQAMSPSPSRMSPRSPLMSCGSGSGDGSERYSRKVFVGGLPPDIDEEEINASFRRFGSLLVDWPHKAESKSYFPPKGYAFLLFQEEMSVQKLIESCLAEEDKLYLYVSSPTIKDKAVQIRPWKLSDADFVLDASLPLDPRKTVFVGGVPRPLKAVELALILDRLYGGVCYAGIDIDPELKYPKGAGRVAFSNQQSYIAAISARFVQLRHAEIDKRVEVKPYVLDDQFCDECQGSQSGGRFAPFFCANINCLQYYCESCWAVIHSQSGREFHKPLVKEGADRPRALHFRW